MELLLNFYYFSCFSNIFFWSVRPQNTVCVELNITRASPAYQVHCCLLWLGGEGKMATKQSDSSQPRKQLLDEPYWICVILFEIIKLKLHWWFCLSMTEVSNPLDFCWTWRGNSLTESGVFEKRNKQGIVPKSPLPPLCILRA